MIEQQKTSISRKKETLLSLLLPQGKACGTMEEKREKSL